MFSLLVTLVSIALVAALAVSTLFFGGDAITNSGAKARAARMASQGEQILAAANLFKSNHGRWPSDMSELADGRYLKAIPMASTGGREGLKLALQKVSDTLVPPAYANDIAWKEVSLETPQYILSSRANLEVCQTINQLRRGDNGIKVAADPLMGVQCFGTAAPYTVLAQIPLMGVPLTTATLQTATGDTSLTVEAGGGAWHVEPTTSGGGSTPESPTEPTPPSPPSSLQVSDDSTGTSLTKLTFADTPVSETSAALTLRLTNNGTNPVHFANTQVSATAPFAVFATTCPSDGDLQPAPAAGSSCTVSLTFSPTAVQQYSGQYFTANSTTGTLATTTLEGKGVAVVPAITQLSPTTGPSTGGTLVTVTGSNFKAASQVNFDGTPVTTTYVSSSELRFTSPAGAPSAAKAVTITNPGVAGGTSSSATFTYASEGSVTTIKTGFSIPSQLGNLAITSTGVYGMTMKYFTFRGFDGTTTTIKSSNWQMCEGVDNNMQPYQWAILPNGNIAAIVNCSSPANYGYVAEITPTGTLVTTPTTVTWGNDLTALTVDTSNNIYFNTSASDASRTLWKRASATGARSSVTSSMIQESTGMATDPTSHYIYYAVTNTQAVLYRCDTAIMQSFCTTVGNMGTLGYPGNGNRHIDQRPHLIFDATGQLYAATPSAIYKVNKTTGATSLYLGSPGNTGIVDGVGTAARLNIFSVGRAPDGSMYIHDLGNAAIRRWQ